MRLIDADELERDALKRYTEGLITKAEAETVADMALNAPTVELDADDKINKLERTIAELRKINAELAEAHAAESDALAAQTIDELKTRVWVQSGIIDGLEKALCVALNVIKGGDDYEAY